MVGVRLWLIQTGIEWNCQKSRSAGSQETIRASLLPGAAASEQSVALDLAAITVFRDTMSLQAARQVNGVVRQQDGQLPPATPHRRRLRRIWSTLRKNRLLPRFHVGGPSSRANHEATLRGTDHAARCFASTDRCAPA